jgi:DNA-binding MarR family transcriptional regulator
MATATTTAIDGPAMEAWQGLIVSNARLLAELDAELQTAHRIGLGEYDVLIHLANAEDQSRSMCDLAAAVLLSPSGISRRVDRLEREGLVQRRRAADDARRIEASLTPAGRRFFAKVHATHHDGIRRLFADRYDDGELEALAGLLQRLRADAEDCSV